MLAQSSEGTGSDHEACRNWKRTAACDTETPHPIDGERVVCTRVSVEHCAANTKNLQRLLVIASRRKNISSHWLWNSKFTALCRSSCSIQRQNIFWVCGDLTKIPIPQIQLWAQNVSTFTYSFRRENRTIPVQAAGLWKLTEHCLCEESLNDAQGTG